MASTTPTNIDSSIPEIWAKDTLRKIKRETFWGRFVGGPGAPIVQKSELLNNPGDLLHIQVTDVLSGAGQSTDVAVLEGNEEALATTEIKASPVLYRHGVRMFRRAEKKSILDLRAEGRMRLEEWGKSKIDAVRFASYVATTLPAPLAGDPYTPNAFSVGGPSTGGVINDIAVGDTLSVAAIQQIKLGLMVRLAKPLMIDGFPMYVLVTHPYTTYQLKQEARYESMVREAQVRGDSNPFFRGALAIVDGVVIYEHADVPLQTNGGSVQVSKGIAFGSEFAVEALDESAVFADKLFDYDNEYGISLRFAFHSRRALEQNSTQVYAAAVTV